MGFMMYYWAEPFTPQTGLQNTWTVHFARCCQRGAECLTPFYYYTVGLSAAPLWAPFSSKALLLSIVPVFAALSEAFSSSGSNYPIYCTISQKTALGNCILPQRRETIFVRNWQKDKWVCLLPSHHLHFYLLPTSSTAFSCQNPYLLSFEKYFRRFVWGGRAELSPCLGGLFL